MNTKEQRWVEWLLGVFGTAGLFIALAAVGMGAHGSFSMSWISYVLGTLAFGIGPWCAVALRPHFLTGGVAGLFMAIGGMAVLLIFASIYDLAIPPLVIIAGLILGFAGGALGEPWAGTA